MNIQYEWTAVYKIYYDFETELENGNSLFIFVLAV